MMERLDDAFADRILKHGRSLITNLSILVKLTGIYESANEAMAGGAARVLSDLKPMLGEGGSIAIKIAESSFFIEDMRIKATSADIDNFTSLSKNLEQRGIGVISIQLPLGADDLIHMAYAIRRGNSEAEVQAGIEKHSKSITVGAAVAALREGDIDFRDMQLVARRAYVRAISSYNNILGSLKSGRKLAVIKTKRTIQSLVDCLIKEEDYLLGLTALRNADNYGPHHAVNVTILSIAAGRKLGLSKFQLSRLGMAALFHDVGKADMPQSILNKPSELSPKEMAFLQMHPSEGVKKLLMSRGLNELSMLSMLVSYEHHINADRSGYPRTERSPGVFSRIVRVADEYDSLVSGKVYSRRALSVPDALKSIVERSGTIFDPLAVKAFAGIFSSG